MHFVEAPNPVSSKVAAVSCLILNGGLAAVLYFPILFVTSEVYDRLGNVVLCYGPQYGPVSRPGVPTRSSSSSMAISIGNSA
jgi:hypothetical protein